NSQLTTLSSPLSLHDALPIFRFTDVNGDGLADVVWMTDSWMKQFLGRGDGTFVPWRRVFYPWGTGAIDPKYVQLHDLDRDGILRSEEHTSELQSRENLVCRLL